LTLPPSPFEELPDLVRFQALREFTTIGEDWPLDFVHVDAGDDDTFSVLAAAISPKMVAQIQATCSAAELSAKRLVLRPFAAASLLRRHDDGLQPCRLIVDLLADEADLTVLVDESVVLTRTVRVVSSDAATAQSRALLGEIRRTIASAQNQLRGQRVGKVILCGGESEHRMLQETIESELSLPVERFDPFSKLPLAGDARSLHLEHPGSFAPLLGMLLDEADDARHAVDFLHPRQRPEPPNQRRRMALIGATAAVAVLAVGFLTWNMLSDLDDESAERQLEQQRLEKKLPAAVKTQAAASAVEAFLDSDITWLDELADLSQDLPPAEDVLITQLNFSTRSPRGGQIIIDGHTREPDQLVDVQESLRARGRSIVSTGTQYDRRRSEYAWRFKETALIEPREPPRAKPAAATETPPAKAAATDNSANEGSSPQ